MAGQWLIILLSSAVCSFIYFFVLFAITLGLFYIDRLGAGVFSELTVRPVKGLRRSTIAAVPVGKLTAEDGWVCAVCLDGGEAASGDACSWCVSCACGELVRVLPRCNHRFHVLCIEKWLRISNSCPLCRRRVAEEHCLPLEIV